MFVQVHAAPIEVKKAYRYVSIFTTPPALHQYPSVSKTALYYVCSGCQSFHEQPLGKIVEKTNESSGNTNLQYKTQSGPPIPQRCDECGGVFHVRCNYIDCSSSPTSLLGCRPDVGGSLARQRFYHPLTQTRWEWRRKIWYLFEDERHDYIGHAGGFSNTIHSESYLTLDRNLTLLFTSPLRD